MTREEKEQTGKYVLQIARLLEDGCYQQEMLLKAVHIIDEAIDWIPVNERLPEEGGEYLITIKDRTYLEISWFYPSNKEWSYRNAEIIAWMPLPKPYKERSDKE